MTWRGQPRARRAGSPTAAAPPHRARATVRRSPLQRHPTSTLSSRPRPVRPGGSSSHRSVADHSYVASVEARAPRPRHRRLDYCLTRPQSSRTRIGIVPRKKPSRSHVSRSGLACSAASARERPRQQPSRDHEFPGSVVHATPRAPRPVAPISSSRASCVPSAVQFVDRAPAQLKASLGSPGTSRAPSRPSERGAQTCLKRATRRRIGSLSVVSRRRQRGEPLGGRRVRRVSQVQGSTAGLLGL